MSDDEASFEVHLRDGVSRNAKSAAAGFLKVHRAASGKGVAKGTKDLDQADKQLKKSARTMRAYGSAARKTARVNPFGEFGKGTDVFRSPGHVARMWDEMVGGHRRFANAQAETRRKASFEAFQKKNQQRGEMMGDLGGMFAAPALVGGGVAAFAAFETGKATLSAVKYRDEVLTGLKLITGSAGEANRVFNDSIKLSDKLGIDWQTTVGGMQKLLAKGFEEDFATDLTKGLADLKIVAPDANVGNLLLAIGQIKTAGKLQGDELNQLTEAGLNSDLMFKQLEKRLGKTRAEVLKLKEGGKLLADDVLPAILDSIQTMTGKELGAAAMEAVDTVAGRMRRLEQLPGRFFLSVAEELQGSNLDGAFGSLLEALDPESEAYGAAVQGVADAVMFTAEFVEAAIPLAKEFGGAFADAFAAFTGLDTGSSIIDALKDPATLEIVREWGVRVGNLAGALARVLDLLARFGPEMADAGSSAMNAFAGGQGPVGAITAAAHNIAGNMIDGFVDTLFGGTEQARAGGVALANAAEEGMRSRQGADIHSPSKKTAKVAAFMNEGLTTELSAGVGDAKKAGQELGSAPIKGMASKMPAVSSASSGGNSSGGSVTIGDITIPINGLDPDVMKDPNALARAIHREIRILFEGVAQQGTIQTDEA